MLLIRFNEHNAAWNEVVTACEIPGTRSHLDKSRRRHFFRFSRRDHSATAFSTLPATLSQPRVVIAESLYSLSLLHVTDVLRELEGLNTYLFVNNQVKWAIGNLETTVKQTECHVMFVRTVEPEECVSTLHVMFLKVAAPQGLQSPRLHCNP